MAESHQQNHDDATEKSPTAVSKPFCCDVCGKEYKSLKVCRDHTKRVHGERRYACPVEDCRFSTNHNATLQAHMRSHSGEKPFTCDVLDCGKSFGHRNVLKDHKRAVHELSRPFLCQLCAYCSSSKGNLDKHVKAVHDKVNEWRCQACSKNFSTKANLTTHIATVHEKRPRFRCDKCGKSFYHRADLERHALAHFEDAKFKCDVCEKQFSYKHNLAAHIKRIHENLQRPKNHKCTMCAYATPYKNHLELHVRAHHTKERPFRCTECSRSFAQKNDLRKHMQLHGTQTFKCTECDRQYRCEHSLQAHMKIHGEKLQCEYCDHATHHMSSLKRHVLRHHKDHLRQTIVAAHSEAPCFTPKGEVTASKGNIWEKYEHAPGLIGRGDFGNVFRAKLRSTQGTEHGYCYAIKSVDLTTIELEPEAHLLKCRQEVQLMHECRHENVIPIYEFFEFYFDGEPDKFYMVMELGSESLAFIKKNNAALTETQCLYVFAKIAAALKHVHSRGIVHRDVKPDNIMICFNGVPKLCDFGESTHLRADETCIGHAGSPFYMAPDMGTATKPTAYGPKADMFSFGMSAAEVAAPGSFSVIRTTEADTLEAIRARIGNMSVTYQDFVLACVVFDPSKRPSSRDIHDSLENGPAKDLDPSCLDNIVQNFIH